MRSRLLKVLAAAFVVVMIVLVVQSLRREGPAALAAWRSAHIRWPWIVVAIACAGVGHSAFVFGWRRRLLRDAGIAVSYWALLRIYLASNLGRYLPAGKAWQMAIVAGMSVDAGLPPAIVAASSLFQGLIGVGVGILVLIVAGGTALGLPAVWVLLPIAGVIGLLLAPRALQSLPRLHSIVVRRVPSIDSVSAGTMWTLVWTAAFSWIFWGFGLDALAKALLGDSVASLSAYVAAWTGSFLAGLIAIVSPAGLAAREPVMLRVLAYGGMNAADVLVVVVVARVGVTLLDVVPAAVVLLARRRR